MPLVPAKAGAWVSATPARLAMTVSVPPAATARVDLARNFTDPPVGLGLCRGTPRGYSGTPARSCILVHERRLEILRTADTCPGEFSTSRARRIFTRCRDSWLIVVAPIMVRYQ